jgi:hypothetical protein
VGGDGGGRTGLPGGSWGRAGSRIDGGAGAGQGDRCRRCGWSELFMAKESPRRAETHRTGESRIARKRGDFEKV